MNATASPAIASDVPGDVQLIEAALMQASSAERLVKTAPHMAVKSALVSGRCMSLLAMQKGQLDECWEVNPLRPKRLLPDEGGLEGDGKGKKDKAKSKGSAVGALKRCLHVTIVALLLSLMPPKLNVMFDARPRMRMHVVFHAGPEGQEHRKRCPIGSK